MIENSQLKIIISIYREGSYSAAAKKNRVTQSAVSQIVKTIEKNLEMNLFYRNGNKMIPTSEGTMLINFAINHLKSLENMMINIKSSSNLISGDVVIGTFFGLGKSWVSRICLDILKVHPNLKTTVEMSLLEPLLHGFNNGEIDLLILPEEASTTIYEHKECIGHESLVLVYPKLKQYKNVPTLSLEELSKLPAICFEKENDHSFYKWYECVFKKVPKSINKRFVINSHGNILQAVSEGLGIAIVPDHVLRRSVYKNKVLSSEKLIVKGEKIFLISKKEDSKIKRINLVYSEIKKNYKL